MTHSMFSAWPSAVLAAALALAGCGGVATNRSLDSLHQPVVERSRFTLDVAAGPAGLADGERTRLAAWLAAQGLGYGDRVALADGSGGDAARAEVAALASLHGLVLEDATGPVPDDVPAGVLRVAVTRSRASVPGCPEWSGNSESNPNNATSTNYGCAVNGNLAAMVADPEHLLKGEEFPVGARADGAGKAIAAWRNAPPSGVAGLRQANTSSVSATTGN
jgi:pilus assembly protein CpaD